MKRVLRERRAEIEQQGPTVVKIAYGGKHKKISIAAPGGRTQLVLASATPSV